jgi:mevalonate kinase
LIASQLTNRPGVTFTASANLPIGAGLGSSAAFSTCAATSLLLAHSIVSKPQNERFTSTDTEIIDAYAFLAEKVLHGNPSGIDNAVSVRGGAVAFTRSIGGRQGGLVPLNG